MVVKRNAIRARPLTRAERSAAVTWPMTAVPAGKACTPPTTTGRRSVPRTASSTLLISEPTRVVSSTGRTVPAGSVTSRYSGTLEARRLASSPSALGASPAFTAGTTASPGWRPVEPTGCTAGAATSFSADVLSVLSAVTSARRTSVRPVRVSTTRCSGLTSMRRPDTVTPSFFCSVTVLPGFTSRAERPSEHPTLAARVAITIMASFFITSYLPTPRGATVVPVANSSICRG